MISPQLPAGMTTATVRTLQYLQPGHTIQVWDDQAAPGVGSADML